MNFVSCLSFLRAGLIWLLVAVCLCGWCALSSLMFVVVHVSSSFSLLSSLLLCVLVCFVTSCLFVPFCLSFVRASMFGVRSACLENRCGVEGKTED